MCEISKRAKSSVGEKTNDGSTALHCAARRGHLDVVQWFTMASSASAISPLHDAARKGDLVTVQRLLRDGSVAVDARDSNGITTLHLAAAHGHLNVVLWLLKEGGASMEEKNNDGSTALHYAANWGHRCPFLPRLRPPLLTTIEPRPGGHN